MIEQRSAEWFEARSRILTASNFAAAMGINPYCSRQKLWRMYVGVEKSRDNAHIRRGVEHESDALFKYSVETGLWVDEAGLVIHPNYDWIGASPDGFIGDDGLLEIKCPTNFRDNPPEYHIAQMQGQLEITNRDWCDYVQWVEGEIVAHRIYRDRKWWADAFPKLEEFWGYVQRLEEPPRKRK